MKRREFIRRVTVSTAVAVIPAAAAQKTVGVLEAGRGVSYRLFKYTAGRLDIEEILKPAKWMG